MEKELKEFEFKMQETSFWNNIELAQEITQKAKGIKDRIDRFNLLISSLEDLEVLTEISEEEEDDSSISEIESELRNLVHDTDRFRVEILLIWKI